MLFTLFVKVDSISPSSKYLKVVLPADFSKNTAGQYPLLSLLPLPEHRAAFKLLNSIDCTCNLPAKLKNVLIPQEILHESFLAKFIIEIAYVYFIQNILFVNIFL